MESIAGLLKPWVLVQVLELCPLHRLLDDDLFVLLLLLQNLLDLLAVGSGNSLLALRAVQVVEHDTRPVPLLLDLALETVDVVHVTAAQVHARHLAQT